MRIAVKAVTTAGTLTVPIHGSRFWILAKGVTPASTTVPEVFDFDEVWTSHTTPGMYGADHVGSNHYLFTCPVTGWYRFTVRGAQGSVGGGGNGAQIVGALQKTAGDIVTIVCGSTGGIAQNLGVPGGGMGGGGVSSNGRDGGGWSGIIPGTTANLAAAVAALSTAHLVGGAGGGHADSGDGGGAGGYPNGQDGQGGSGRSGTGGSQIAGGIGGSGSLGGVGANGSFGIGGAADSAGVNKGGGAGAGWYGGGGGGASSLGVAGAGGGGSSYWDWVTTHFVSAEAIGTWTGYGYVKAEWNLA